MVTFWYFKQQNNWTERKSKNSTENNHILYPLKLCKTKLNMQHTDQTNRDRPVVGIPIKNAAKAAKLWSWTDFDSTDNKQFKEKHNSQIERLTLKNSDAMCVGKPSMKFMLYCQMSTHWPKVMFHSCGVCGCFRCDGVHFFCVCFQLICWNNLE